MSCFKCFVQKKLWKAVISQQDKQWQQQQQWQLLNSGSKYQTGGSQSHRNLRQQRSSKLQQLSERGWCHENIDRATMRDGNGSREHEPPGGQQMGQTNRTWCVRSTWPGVCVTVCRMAQPPSWPLGQAHLVAFAAQVQQTQLWFPHSQKPSLEGVWRPRWSSIRDLQLPWCLAVGSIWAWCQYQEASEMTPVCSVTRWMTCSAWEVAEPEVESLRSIWVWETDGIALLHPWEMQHMEALRESEELWLFCHRAEEDVKDRGKWKQVPAWGSRRSSFWPPVPLQVPLQRRRYEALEFDSKDEALSWGFPRGSDIS